MAYITLVLAGRSGNWHLRVHALKKMATFFHLSKSAYYYKLIPRHLADLLRCPAPIISHFKSGGFVMSQTGTAWSNVFLDEEHESTINKDVKGAVSSLTHLNLNTKVHYIPYRASAHKNFLKMFDDGTVNQQKDNTTYAASCETNIKAYSHHAKLHSYSLENKKKITCHF